MSFVNAPFNQVGSNVTIQISNGILSSSNSVFVLSGALVTFGANNTISITNGILSSSQSLLALSSSILVNGNSFISGNEAVTGTLTVSGSATVASAFTANDLGTFSNGLSVASSLGFPAINQVASVTSNGTNIDALITQAHGTGRGVIGQADTTGTGVVAVGGIGFSTTAGLTGAFFQASGLGTGLIAQAGSVGYGAVIQGNLDIGNQGSCKAPLKIVPQTFDPGVLENGAMWISGSHLKIRLNGVTQTII